MIVSLRIRFVFSISINLGNLSILKKKTAATSGGNGRLIDGLPKMFGRTWRGGQREFWIDKRS